MSALGGLLPRDSVITYFKVELVQQPRSRDDAPHVDIIGIFVFRKESASHVPKEAAQRPAATDGGAIFHNVLPGVLMYQGLHVTEEFLDAQPLISFFSDFATGRDIQVGDSDVSHFKIGKT